MKMSLKYSNFNEMIQKILLKYPLHIVSFYASIICKFSKLNEKYFSQFCINKKVC